MANVDRRVDIVNEHVRLGVQFDPNTGIGKVVAFVGHPLAIIRGVLRAVVMPIAPAGLM